MLVRLTARVFVRHRGLIAGMAAVLAAFQVMMVTIGANLQREGLFPQLAAIIPPSVQAALGGTMVTSFAGLVSFGFFHPVVVLALAVGAAYLAGELAADVEEGMIDLLAARPVPRALLVARAALVAMATSALVVLLMLAANLLSTLLLAPGGASAPRARALVLLSMNLLAVTWCCAAVGLALAAVVRKRATAVGAASLGFVSTYLLNFAATWWAPARPFAKLTPFHYFEAVPVMLGTHSPRADVTLLLAATALLVACAHLAYARRDL